MRTGRAIIISAVLAIGAAAPVLANPVIATAAVHAPAAHVQTTTAAGSNTFYRT